MTKIEQLEGRIFELEALLGLNITMAGGDLTRTQMRMVGLLLRKNIVSAEMFYDALYGCRAEGDQPLPKIIDVHLCKLRKKLAPAEIKIKTHWGIGWSLEPGSREALSALVAA